MSSAWMIVSPSQAVRGPGGAATDPDLTAEGQEMAAAFARAYRDRPWACIFSSPLRRARQTAAPLAAAPLRAVHTAGSLHNISAETIPDAGTTNRGAGTDAAGTTTPAGA